MSFKLDTFDSLVDMVSGRYYFDGPDMDIDVPVATDQGLRGLRMQRTVSQLAAVTWDYDRAAMPIEPLRHSSGLRRLGDGIAIVGSYDHALRYCEPISTVSCYIHNLKVKPSERRQGHGTAAMEHLEHYLLNKYPGTRIYIYLCANPEAPHLYPDLVRFYQRLGYLELPYLAVLMKAIYAGLPTEGVDGLPVTRVKSLYDTCIEGRVPTPAPGAV